jgi:hypothetical protein
LYIVYTKNQKVIFTKHHIVGGSYKFDLKVREKKKLTNLIAIFRSMIKNIVDLQLTTQNNFHLLKELTLLKKKKS